jgi:hypothetical protein
MKIVIFCKVKGEKIKYKWRFKDKISLTGVEEIISKLFWADRLIRRLV